jgi:hypothetical protein
MFNTVTLLHVCPTEAREDNREPFDFEEAQIVVDSLRQLDGMKMSFKNLREWLDMKPTEAYFLVVEVNGKNICRIHIED